MSFDIRTPAKSLEQILRGRWRMGVSNGKGARASGPADAGSFGGFCPVAYAAVREVGSRQDAAQRRTLQRRYNITYNVHTTAGKWASLTLHNLSNNLDANNFWNDDPTSNIPSHEPECARPRAQQGNAGNRLRNIQRARTYSSCCARDGRTPVQGFNARTCSANSLPKPMREAEHDGKTPISSRLGWHHASQRSTTKYNRVQRSTTSKKFIKMGLNNAFQQFTTLYDGNRVLWPAVASGVPPDVEGRRDACRQEPRQTQPWKRKLPIFQARNHGLLTLPRFSQPSSHEQRFGFHRSRQDGTVLPVRKVIPFPT